MQKNKYLTKSKFKSALECPRKLFYYDKKAIYANQNSENDFLMALAEGGYQVGELAKLYFPGGHDIKTLGYDEALNETDRLLKNDDVIIYEAAVMYKNCFVRVDILKKTKDLIRLIEVKAKSFNSEIDSFTGRGDFITSAWKPYLYDIAFQTYVAEHSSKLQKYRIDPYLMLADKSLKTSVNGLNQIFKIKKDNNDRVSIITPGNINDKMLGDKILTVFDVRKYVDMIFEGIDISDHKKQDDELLGFEERINKYCDYYSNDKPYPVHIGQKCKKCEYKTIFSDEEQGLQSGYKDCWREACGENFNFEIPHVFDLWNFRKCDELIKSHIYYLKDIPSLYFEKDTPVMQRQKLQIDKICNDGEEDEFISPDLYTEINKWKYPLHFIDFETTMTAIPFNDNKRPYEQIAFQFSCHTLYKNGEVKHDEFLASEPGAFPNFKFVAALKNVLDKDDGTIFRYAPHENTVLKQIQLQMEEKLINDGLNDKDNLNELIEWIDTITQWKVDKVPFFGIRNMVDLLKMVKEYYYHPRMGGKNSIKVVLPSVLSASSFLKEKYSKPLKFGTNLKGMTVWEVDKEKNEPVNPYKKLPSVFQDIDIGDDIELIMDADGDIREGGAALTAYARMQFSEMTSLEREAIAGALLKYCELDTLAMVMIYEHWRSKLS
ncbi:MAG TPA: DUF2779 domain-containing protein [Victivallales bacterium]|nr:DUF2779 domain-containing protein [Victivallales bacterium]